MKILGWTISSFKSVLRNPAGSAVVAICAGFGGIVGPAFANDQGPLAQPCSPHVPANCEAFDTCSNQVDCHRVGTVWQKILPANYLAWKSGPKVPMTCHRLYYSTSACSDGTRSDFNRDSCGHPQLVIDPAEPSN